MPMTSEAPRATRERLLPRPQRERLALPRPVSTRAAWIPEQREWGEWPDYECIPDDELDGEC